MEKNEILTRVKDVVSSVLKNDPAEITDDANFIFDLGADSMQSVELVAGFEEPFVKGLHRPGFFDVWRHGFMVNCFLMPLKYGKNLK